MYLKLFGDRTIDSVAVFIDKDSARRDALIETIKNTALRWNLPVVSQQQMHEGILAVFDSTFAVTQSMRLIAIIVAFFGIANALLTLFIERQREFGIYRALGFSTVQVAGMTLMEGIAMGLVSFVLCAVVGTALAFVLIKVINFHSFNWTVFYFFEWKPYLHGSPDRLACKHRGCSVSGLENLPHLPANADSRGIDSIGMSKTK